MCADRVDDEKLIKKIGAINRARKLWFVLWVPAAYMNNLIYHSLLNREPPVLLDIIILFAWILAGYVASFYAYRRLVTPIYGRPSFRDSIALEVPKG
jgi:hypothetical protein